MFVLVESIASDYLLEESDLGCALIMGIAEENRIKNRFIQGQLNLIKSLFGESQKPILALITDLDHDKYPELDFLNKEKPGEIYEKNLDLFNYFYHRKSNQVFFDYRKYFNYRNSFKILAHAAKTLIIEGLYDEFPLVDSFVSQILAHDPDLIGFSMAYGFDPISRLIRKKIKETTEIPIVVGGAHTPFIKPLDYKEMFVTEYFDYLIVGQGDLAFPRLYAALNANQNPQNIPNVFYNRDGEVVGTPPEIVEDLDQLPFPDFSQFDLDHYYAPNRILPVQSSRGCSWGKCAFCSHEVYAQRKYRELSIPRLISMLEHLQQTYQTDSFDFHDAEISPERMEEISKAILASPSLQGSLNIRFLGRLESGFLKPGLFEEMHEAGVMAINWGLESGNQRILNLMRKGIRVDDAGRILQSAHSAGISNLVFIIWGFPGETDAERKDTLAFIHRNRKNIQLVLTGSFYLKTLSPMGRAPQKWGLIVDEKGEWRTNDGCFSSRQSEQVGQRLGREIALGKIPDVSFPVVGSYWGDYSAEMLIYILNSYDWVPFDQIADLAGSKSLDQLIPVIPGTRKKQDFIFYNFNKPFFLDAFSYDAKKLSEIEWAAIQLSDGSRTVSEIIQEVLNFETKNISLKQIDENLRLFFKKVLINHWGLAFRKRFGKNP